MRYWTGILKKSKKSLGDSCCTCVLCKIGSEEANFDIKTIDRLALAKIEFEDILIILCDVKAEQ